MYSALNPQNHHALKTLGFNTSFDVSLTQERPSLDDVLKPAIEIEHELRDLFATGKSHERLADPHVGLVGVFNASDEIRATRANRSRRPGSFCCCHPCAAVVDCCATARPLSRRGLPRPS
ncbi:hypothetical protein B0H14DRAFT_1100466 [Mycena olivaceomarginata]|nr:hypothetical protein B0H14DRAFT_1100466 [Mycena olivaceomarginata]